MKIPTTLVIEVIALIFAAGITFGAIRSQGVAIENHTVALKVLTTKVSEHESILATNRTEHKYIIKQLDIISEKLDPIIEIAIRGNVHMANDTKHGVHDASKATD